MRSYIPKQAPTRIRHHNFKKFDNSASELNYLIISTIMVRLMNTTRSKIYTRPDTFNKHASMIEKYVRANNSPFWIKTFVPKW